MSKNAKIDKNLNLDNTSQLNKPTDTDADNSINNVKFDFFASPKVITIKELHDKYLLINTDMVKAMNFMIELIDVRKNISLNDVEVLSKLNIDYSKLQIDNYIIAGQDEETKKNILEASFKEAYTKSIQFFKCDDIYNTSPTQLGIYKSEIIKIAETNALEPALKFIEDLYFDFSFLHRDFNKDYSHNPFDYKFDFTQLIYKAFSTKELIDKKQGFVNAKTECEMYFLMTDNFNPENKIYKNFISKCVKAIECIDFQLKNTPLKTKKTTIQIPSTAQTQSIQDDTCKFKLAKNRKTDFIKLISAMYDLRMFETKDGYISSSKQEIMNEFGRMVGEDLSTYSTLLSKAKNIPDKECFMKIYEEIKRKGSDYFDKKPSK